MKIGDRRTAYVYNHTMYLERVVALNGIFDRLLFCK